MAAGHRLGGRREVPARPAVVARPTDTAQVAAVLALCNEARVPVTAAGGRSGVCGASVPVFGGVALDLCGLAGIGDVDADSLVADLRAGTFGPDVEAGLRGEHGLTLGHWPQSMDLSTVGGWLACRGAGQYSNRYGKIEDMVIGLEVVLADGRVVRTGGHGPRSATGPDLTQLFVGSEGTLGVITEGRFRVHPVPCGRGPPRLRVRRRSPTGSTPAAGSCAAAPPRPSSASTTRPSRAAPSTSPTPTCSSSWTRPTPAWSTPPWPWSTRSAATPTPLDVELVERWLGPPQRRLGPGPAVAGRHRGRHRRGVGAVDGAARPLPVGARRPRTASRGPWWPRPTSRHAYTDGACLYFTFAGRPPGTDRTADAEAGPRPVGRAVLPRGLGRGHPGHDGGRRGHQPPPRHRHQPGPVPARRPGNGLRRAGRGQAGARPQRHPQPRQARPRRPVRPGALAVSILVVDVGTSGVRGAVVRPDGAVEHIHHVPVLPDTPFPGLVEFDAAAMAEAVVEVASRSLAEGGPGRRGGHRQPAGVDHRVGPGHRRPGRARASGGRTSAPSAPASSSRAKGIRVAPNASATKLAAILDMADPDRSRSERGELAFGTVDTWVAWTLSGGRLHVTDASNAGVTGLIHGDGSGWSPELLDGPAHPRSRCCPTIVDSSGAVGAAEILAGRPVIAGMAGDQQASLIGQGCTRPGLAKATFGTGGMLDQCVGPERPAQAVRGPAGDHPDHRLAAPGHDHLGGRGHHAVGRHLRGVAPRRPGHHRHRRRVGRRGRRGATTPATCGSCPPCSGLGTPVWDFGARGTFLGLTRGSGRPELVRAVLEGVAHRGADLLEAAESDSGLPVGTLRVDGGHVRQPGVHPGPGRRLRAAGRDRTRSLEATTLGAAYLAGMAVGTWADEDDVAAAWTPRPVVTPTSDDDERGPPGPVARGPGPVRGDHPRAVRPRLLSRADRRRVAAAR